MARLNTGLFKVAIMIPRESEIRRRYQYAGKRRGAPLPRIEERTKTVQHEQLADTIASALQAATVLYAGYRAYVTCARPEARPDVPHGELYP